jgi:hypothetical protein
MAEIIGSDSVVTGGKNVVEKMLADVPGGAELDLTGVTTEYDSDGYIPEGTPIIVVSGKYRPLLEANLEADDDKVVGILYQEVPKAKPYASICIRGVVNEAKLPFAINATVKGALPGISFI